MTLGNKIATLRRENFYTQEQLAEKLNVSRQSVSKWESDLTYPETDKLKKLSLLFGVSIDYLLLDSHEDTFKINNYQTPVDNMASIDYSSFFGNWCNIDLKNWNFGEYSKVIIIGQNDEYLFFYSTNRKSILKLGMVLKKHIDSVRKLATIKKTKEYTIEHTIPLEINTDPFKLFLGKNCDIQIDAENFVEFLFTTDDYQNIKLISVSENSIVIEENSDTIILNKNDIVGIIET